MGRNHTSGARRNQEAQVNRALWREKQGHFKEGQADGNGID